MASEIRVNKIENRSGLGTVTFADTGVDLAGISTAATLKVTTGIVTTLTATSSAKVGSGVTLSPDGDIFATGVCTASSFSGDGSNLTGISGVSVANQSDNRLITATGTTDALNAESGAIITADSELIVGMTAGGGAAEDARLQVRGDTYAKAKIQVLGTHNDDNPVGLTLAKSRGSGNTILGDNDDIGQIDFAGNDGNGFHNVGRIMVSSDGSGNGNDDLPSMMRFFTTPNGGVSLTERVRITNDGNLKFNSGYGSVSTAFGVRAWVSFNGTGTPAIRGDGGVSSVGDNDTGDYTVNFDSNMPDVNYAVGGLSENWEGTNNDSYTQISGYTGGAVVGSYRFVTLRSRFDQHPPAKQDPPFVQLIFVR